METGKSKVKGPYKVRVSLLCPLRVEGGKATERVHEKGQGADPLQGAFSPDNIIKHPVTAERSAPPLDTMDGNLGDT